MMEATWLEEPEVDIGADDIWHTNDNKRLLSYHLAS